MLSSSPSGWQTLLARQKAQFFKLADRTIDRSFSHACPLGDIRPPVSFAVPPAESDAIGVSSIGDDKEDALHRYIVRALFSSPPERFPAHDGLTFPRRIASAQPGHGFAVRACKPRQVGARCRTPWISAVMLPKPIGTKRAATRASDLGMGQSTIASAFGVNRATPPEEGPFNRQIAPA